jgi:hypothetical protein
VGLIDITQPTLAPQTILSNVAIDGATIQGDWLIAYGRDLRIFSIAAVNRPVLLGKYVPPTPATLALVDQHAFMVDERFGFQSWDVAAPVAPVQLSHSEVLTDTFQPAPSMAVNGKFVYVASWGLSILDVNALPEVAVVGQYDSDGFVGSLVVSGTLAYLAVDESVQVIDVSDPTSPQAMATYTAPGKVRGLTLFGNLVYVAADRGGLRVLDSSDPERLIEIGVYRTRAKAVQSLVAGSIAYVSESWQADQGEYHVRVTVLDMSNPSHPRRINTYEPIWSGWFVAGVQGPYLFMDTFDGIHAMDFSRPTDPVEVGYIGLPNQSLIGWDPRLASDQHYLYLPAQGAGVYILRFVPPTQAQAAGQGTR